jgi:hypothetical protein
MKPSLIAAIVILLSAPLEAQWLTYRTPGLPRLADSKPNLAAPAPRTPEGKPDLSGLWQRIESKYAENIAADLKPGEVQRWAQDLVKDRVENLSKEHMSVQCLPWGPNYANSARMTKIVQTPNLIVMLDEGLTYRQIFTDGRPLETDPNPSWMGYSVGHWDGDTLVVDSFGYNDRSWLDHGGHPHTQALRITERYRRPDLGHLQIEMTVRSGHLCTAVDDLAWRVARRRYRIAGRSLQRRQWKPPAALHRQGLRRKENRGQRCA